MTVEELAYYLRLTLRTAHQLIQKNSIPATRVGLEWQIDETTIENWLNERQSRKPATILIVDDEEIIRTLFQETLEEIGHIVMLAKDAWEGLDLLKLHDFDLIFMDLKMPGMDGGELLARIKNVKPLIPVTLISGYPDGDARTKALEQNPFGVMNKPFGESDIIRTVHNFLRIISDDNSLLKSL